MEKVRHEGNRFFMPTPHGEAELFYEIANDVMSIYHTFVPDADRGKGLAAQLATEAFRFASSRNLRVKPDCPYIPHFLEEHPEFKKQAIS